MTALVRAFNSKLRIVKTKQEIVIRETVAIKN